MNEASRQSNLRSVNGGPIGLNYDPFRRFFSNLDPQIDVVRTESGFEVEIPVPGFRPEQIEVTVKDEVLTISGKSERRAFTRSLQLPDDVDPDTIEARVEHGMLALALRRHPQSQPRKITVVGTGKPSEN